jgi:eukaryotic-like serine/threonine-protein kinase
MLPLNSTLGKYRLIELIGRGGMGEVYRAQRVDTGETVAVKALGAAAFTSPSGLARFRNEAIIQYNLNHPAIAKLYEYFEYGGRPCIAMEYVDGVTLDELIARNGPLSPQTALDLFRELVEAIGFVHSSGVVHRDLKASNVKIASSGHVKILDFGIAHEEHIAGLTRVGHVIGTLENLAPEQAIGGKGDARSDIWSLAVVLYQALTGRMPFEDVNTDALTAKILRGVYIPLRQLNPSIPADLERLIARCLRRRPEDRFASATELLVAINRLRAGRRSTPLFPDSVAAGIKNPISWAVAGGVVALAILFWMLMPGPEPTKVAQTFPPPQPPPAAVTESHGVPDNSSKETRKQPAVMPPRTKPPETPAAPIELPPPVDVAGRQPQPEPPPVVPPPVEPPKQKSAPPTPKPTLPAPTPPSPKPAKRPEFGKVVAIVIETTPSSANVYNIESGVMLGATPLRFGAQAGVELNLTLRQPGFKDKTIKIVAGDRPTYRYQLDPR